MVASLQSRYWPARFAQWPGPPTADAEGYTLAVPVPGDLPVFLELALEVCSRQDPEHRVETVVVPDRVTPQVGEIVDSWSAAWRGPLRTVAFPQPERRLLPALKNPFHNYGMQFVTAVGASRASHVLMHDADLFMATADFHRRHFRASRDAGLAAGGISAVWDPWYAAQDLRPAATWELCVEREWARAFPPYLHMGHEGELAGERHVFDITLLPQSLTDPRRIGIPLGDDEIVHFNHVIGSYRNFTKTRDAFSDHDFRLLLIAVFIDLFARVRYDYSTPDLAELLGCLSRPGRVRYPDPGSAEDHYAEFRAKLEGFLGLAWLEPQRSARVRDAVGDFDRHYSYLPATGLP